MSAHAWVKLKCLSWAVCSGCGLIRLRNEATDIAAKKPCTGSED